ncbi:2-succinyl-6-hydroxy-2,4-cyclohexadiene-1-carboxylate synthase [Ectobacillus polymachus]|uniref:2-succinyl-6-hydroxy-2, 4-cyclohexadiene-1-carboxylate synthase n=1 Tax=Ectobacillus polymachus TaxID=1508806 RepID=UPI003A87CDD7
MIKAQGVSYDVEIVGEGEPLLLLHGFTGSKETWRSFLPSWSNHFRVIAVDLLGHGKTDHPTDELRYHIETIAQDLLMILDSIHVEQAHILGYSMGGRVAITFAKLYPHRVRSLILESTTAGIEDENERIGRVKKDRKLADFIEKSGVSAFVTRWEDIPLFASQKHLPKQSRDDVRNERLLNHAIGLSNSLRGMGTGVQPSWWQRLHEFHMPVLLLCGEYDEKFIGILARMEQMLPNATRIQISEAGHAIHVEQPEKFDTIVMGFLKSLTNKEVI